MSGKTKPVYCCICSNYGGKVVDGRKVSVHRFPQDVQRRKIWINRCRLARADFKYQSYGSTRLCSAHFVGGQGPTVSHNLPSVFPSNTIKTSYHGPHTAFSSSGRVSPRLEPLQLTVEEDGVLESNMNGNEGDQTLPSGDSNLDTSVRMHSAYCAASVDVPGSSMRNKVSQTPVWKVPIELTDTGSQTNSAFNIAETPSSDRDNIVKSQVSCRTSYSQADRPSMTYEDIKHSDEKVMFYTGIPHAYIFEGLYEQLKVKATQQTARCTSTETHEQCTSKPVFSDGFDGSEGIECHKAGGGRPRSLRLIDEFLLVLMRLRLGLLLEDLADRFKISTKTCCTIFNTWIDFLDTELSFLIQWPSRERIDEYMPDTFKRKYPKCRVILDCTEIYTQTPRSLALKSALYSDYKSHMTFKSLVGISPAGVVTFVSDLYSGSTSDKQITERCGIVDLCEEGDAIMVDKGFLISDLTTPKGIHLIIPPFKNQKKQLSKSEVLKTKCIANLRIHVERQMERIKNFRILQGIMPISMSSQASKIWRLCTSLTNLQPPLVYKD